RPQPPVDGVRPGVGPSGDQGQHGRANLRRLLRERRPGEAGGRAEPGEGRPPVRRDHPGQASRGPGPPARRGGRPEEARSGVARGEELMAVKPAEPQAVVIFGASGDLTRRKLLPAFFHLFVEGLLPQGFAIVGYARTEQTDEEFHERARQAVMEFGRTDPAGEEWEEFKKRLSYVPGE